MPEELLAAAGVSKGQLAPLGKDNWEKSRTKRNSPFSGYQEYPFIIPLENPVLILHEFLFMSGFREA